MELHKLFERVNNFTDARFGRRFQPSPEARLRKVRNRLIQEFNCESIIDVGANAGQWATGVRDLGYSGKIFSFEPSDAFASLQVNSKYDSSWFIEKIALSNYTGVSQFYVSTNSNLSSSMLKPSGILHQNFGFGFVTPIEVKVKRLDSIDFNGKNLYLKIDVQGSEYEVISGAVGLIPNVSVIEFESSTIQLYENEKNHYSIANLLIDYGFTPRQIVVTHWDANLATVSLDSIFSKSKAS